MLALALLLIGPELARAEAGSPGVRDDPSIASFMSLKKDVEELRQDPERKKFRHNYEKLIVRLQAVANTHKEGSRADDCAFVAAQLLEELASVSVVSADKEAAVDAFASMAERFPKSNLKDDALIAAARLTDDVVRGRGFVDSVLLMAVADLKPQATELKKTRFNDTIVKAAKKNPTVTIASALEKVQPATTTTTTTTTLLDLPRVAMKPVAVLPERPPPGTPSRKVIVIRHDRTDGESQVRLRISGDVGVMRGEVPENPDRPGRRIFYDVAPARLGQRNIQPIEVHDGVVARVRAGQYDTDVVRLVIELEGKKEPTLTVTRKPFELVLSSPIELPPIDLLADVVVGVGPVSAPAIVRAKVVAPDPVEVKARLGARGSPGGVSISQQLGLKVHRVVLDAGHGGHDVGAIGPSGIKEKDITLQIANRVKQKLNAELPDVEVIMTRSDDRTLSLQDRTNTANTSAADLFISIHCNASVIRRVRGVETYYLNITHDRYAMRLAARENSELGEGSISDLDFILADLAMKSNVDDSVGLGRSVQKSVMKKLHQTWSDVPDLGLKHALFYVLMGNKMPSILVETSFLSNPAEEKRLGSPEYQDAIANGVVDGVRTFVDDRQAFLTAP
jgi:N-acetylmuramoyl-L-alanine amidase